MVKLDHREMVLLGFLLTNRSRVQSRAHIVELFWPEKPCQSGPHCLSTALWRLRKGLERFAGLTLHAPRGGGVRILADDTVTVDFLRFEQLVEPIIRSAAHRSGMGLTPQQLRDLEAAIDLYGGELLPGVGDCWVDHDRQRLQDDYLACLSILAAHYERCAEYERALKSCSEILRLDPAREDIHRRVMAVHEAQGRRARALRQYELCVDSMRTELGVEVADETRLLAETISRKINGVRSKAAALQFAPPAPDLHDLRAKLMRLVDQLNAVSSASARLLDQLAVDCSGGTDHNDISPE